MGPCRSNMENLPRADRPQVVEPPAVPKPNMKDNLGPRFPEAVSQLVSWFIAVEDHFDLNPLRTAIEEILSEHGNMSDLALQTLIRERYA